MTEATARVEQVEKEAADMVPKINEVISALQAAQSDAERTAAAARLVVLQKEHAVRVGGAVTAQ
jgi:hypothetical protein